MSEQLYDWYKIFNLTEWLAEGLVQRTLVVDLEDLGQTTFLITQGNTTAVLFEDNYLPINFLDQNPYAQDGMAIYKDASDDVWIGFEVDS